MGAPQISLSALRNLLVMVEKSRVFKFILTFHSLRRTAMTLRCALHATP